MSSFRELQDAQFWHDGSKTKRSSGRQPSEIDLQTDALQRQVIEANNTRGIETFPQELVVYDLYQMDDIDQGYGR